MTNKIKIEKIIKIFRIYANNIPKNSSRQDKIKNPPKNSGFYLRKIILVYQNKETKPWEY